MKFLGWVILFAYENKWFYHFSKTPSTEADGAKLYVLDIDFDTNHSSSCPKYLDSLLLQFTTTKCVLYTWLL